MSNSLIHLIVWVWRQRTFWKGSFQWLSHSHTRSIVLFFPPLQGPGSFQLGPAEPEHRTASPGGCELPSFQQSDGILGYTQGGLPHPKWETGVELTEETGTASHAQNTSGPAMLKGIWFGAADHARRSTCGWLADCWGHSTQCACGCPSQQCSTFSLLLF